ncbi:MAG: ATP-binding protein [Hespellia sp.]|nr:ATP-binding protein [Hespellia sp.]
MGLKASQYQAIMRTYEQKQLKSHDIATKRYEEVCGCIPEFKSLDDSIAALSVQHGRRLLDGDENALLSLREKIDRLREDKRNLLKNGGFSVDYLEPVYECQDCQDTGYIGNEKCHCLEQAIIESLYQQSNLKDVLIHENFNTFSMQYYSENFVDPKTNRSSRAIMTEALQTCKAFTVNFQSLSPNLLLYGDVGVGKTFLSHCIAKELMDAGYSVLYFSSAEFFSIFERITFHKDDGDAENIREYIHDCDLLIIDDLGTEMTNNFITSSLFTCINERLLNQKSTIISTNITLDTLADLYTERTFSRITSNYTMLRIVGDDIRIKKRLMNREDA